MTQDVELVGGPCDRLIYQLRSPVCQLVIPSPYPIGKHKIAYCQDKPYAVLFKSLDYVRTDDFNADGLTVFRFAGER